MDEAARSDPAVLEAGYRALLRSHDQARVAAINNHGLFVAMPVTLGEHRHRALHARSALDLIETAQRDLVIETWDRVRSVGAAQARVTLRRGDDASLYFFDLRARHGVLMGVLIPDGNGNIDILREAEDVIPRLCTQRKNENAVFLEVDEATTKMLGRTAEEFVGHGSIEFVHPDDHERAIESWMDLLANADGQRRARLRYRHADGTWIWLELTNHNLLDDPLHKCVVTEMLDVTDEMAAHEAVRSREQLLRRVAETVPLGLLHLDRSGETLYANERLYAMLSVPKADDRSPFVRLRPDDRMALEAALATLMVDGADRDLEVGVRTRRRADTRLCLLRLRALTDSDGEVAGAIVCVEDVTERALARAELERRATYDPLTGCLNRASVLQHLTAQLDTATELGVIFIDLDGFKGVNDEYGHGAGDDVLVEVAQRVQQNIRDNDTLGRLGGDEFLVVCPDGDSDALTHIASRITNSLAAPLDLKEGAISIRASIGISCASCAETTTETLVADADTAMYVAKRNQDGRPVTYDSAAHCNERRAVLDGGRIFHININCSDLERSRAFYVEGCGLAEGVRTTPEQPQSGVAFGLDRARWDAWILVGENGFDGGAIDLLEWQEPTPTSHTPGALFHAGFQRIGVLVPDLDDAIRSISECGGVAWSDPIAHQLAGGGEVRLVIVSDPDGVAVELVEGDVSRLSFVAVACSDVDRSVAFYQALGFRELARFPSGRDEAPHLRVEGPVSMLEVLMRAPGGGDVHFMLADFDEPAVVSSEPRAANALGMWRCALLVPELDRVAAALRAAGIALLSEPQSMAMGPGLPDLRFVCFRGPDHEVIELIEQPQTPA